MTIGPPGVGKSFFARQFAETFNAPLISFDEIRYELFNEIAYTSDEDIIVARVAGLQLRELLRTKKTIIIDGGHNPKISRTELEKVVKKSGYDVLNIWVQADEKTARTRSTRRSQAREEDRYNRSLSDDEFASHARKFTAPTRYESVVVISGRHTYPSQARTVLKRLAGNHENTQTTPPVKRPVSGASRSGRSVRVQ